MNEIDIIFTTGLRIRVTRRELFEIMQEPVIIAYVVLGGLMAGYIVPLDLINHVSEPVYFVAIVAKSLTALLMLHLTFFTLHALTSYARRLPLPSSVAMLVTSLLLEAVWVAVLPLVIDHSNIPHSPYWGPGLTTSFVAMIIGEVIYSLFTLRMTAWWKKYQNKIAQGEKPAPAQYPSPPQPISPPKDIVLIGKDVVKCNELLFAKAEQHYVSISLTGRNLLVRARFDDICAQLPETLGVRIHRSYWVAFAAIDDLASFPDGRAEVILRAGDRLPVSRAYRRQLIAHISRGAPAQRGNLQG